MTDPTTPDLLLELIHKMQRTTCDYLTDDLSQKDFISKIIYMLDGPEQRAAEAAHPRPQPAATVALNVIDGVELKDFAKQLRDEAKPMHPNYGELAPRKDIVMHEAASAIDRAVSAIQPEAPNARAEALREAARVCAGDEDRPSPISAEKLRRMSVQDQFAHEQRRLAWADADEILALIDQPAPDPAPPTVQESVQEAVDWEGFGRDVMKDHFEAWDLDNADRHVMAIKHGLLKKIPGGFDPDNEQHHAADEYGADPGDDWYEPTYSALSDTPAPLSPKG